MLNIIGNKNIFLAVSGMLVVLSIVAIVFYGFNTGIEFEGGTLWQMSFSDEKIMVDQIRDLLTKESNQTEIVITQEPNTSKFLVRLSEITEDQHQQYLKALSDKFGQVEELSFETIGPSIGKELRRRSIYAFLAVLITISLYIAIVFRKVSYPVKSWKYGVITLVTLFHDALIGIGFFAAWGHYMHSDLNTNMIVAILVIMGFSVHDTIVVFDRIRENLTHERDANKFSEIVNRSVNETMARSINTSLTLVLVLVALIFWGPANLLDFALVIAVGTIVGTYSSIFIASPLLVVWSGQKTVKKLDTK